MLVCHYSSAGIHLRIGEKIKSLIQSQVLLIVVILGEVEIWHKFWVHWILRNIGIFEILEELEAIGCPLGRLKEESNRDLRLEKLSSGKSEYLIDAKLLEDGSQEIVLWLDFGHLEQEQVVV